ncbi:MAG: hypothetical protein ACREGJ_04740 [Candidatus Saccharimonadales bacterium]
MAACNQGADKKYDGSLRIKSEKVGCDNTVYKYKVTIRNNSPKLVKYYVQMDNRPYNGGNFQLKGRGAAQEITVTVPRRGEKTVQVNDLSQPDYQRAYRETFENICR